MFCQELGIGFVRVEEGGKELHAVQITGPNGEIFSPTLPRSSLPPAMNGSKEEVFSQLQEFLSQNETKTKAVLPPRAVASAAISREQASRERDFTEMERVGWDKITRLSSKLDVCHLELGDDVGRKFQIKIHLPTRQAEADWSPILSTTTLQSNKDTTLTEIYQRYASQVSELQEFWSELDEIDSYCRVLDPVLPTSRAISRRRIALFDANGQVLKSLFLELNLPPLCARLPSCQIVGAPEVLKMEWKLSLEQHAWQTSQSICQNLSLAFANRGGIANNVSSANSGQEASQQEGEECGICYMYRLESAAVEGEEETGLTSELPDASCDKCLRAFHRSCLLAWLRSLPTARRSFKLIMGECAYCGEVMTVRE